MTTAFVLGGGGLLGAHEVGMLRALSEAGIRPDLVVGTSVGAINGAFIAADPAGAAARLGEKWRGDDLRLAFSETLWGRAMRLLRSGTHLHSPEPLRRLLEQGLPGGDFADLELPFHCVAASIEAATARWFSSGPVVPAVMASCAVPGLLPPVEVDGGHYFDGGLVDSIPVGHAVALGATTVYVLHAGRIESPLAVPARPWEVGPARAVSAAGAAGAAVRPRRAVTRGPDAEPAAGVVRGGLAHRRDRRAGHAARPVARQRVRRPDPRRAQPEPPLRDHAPVPRRGVPGRRAVLRAAARGHRAGADRRGAGRAAGAPGHSAVPARRPR